MKTKLIIAALMCCTIMKSQDQRQLVVGISQGLDVANAVRGGSTLGNGQQRNGAAVDYRGRIYFNYHFYEFGAFVEIFPAIDYTSMGLDFGIPFKLTSNTWFDLIVTPSVAAEIVWRDLPDEQVPELVPVQEYLNWSLNLPLRFEGLFGTGLYLEALPLLRMRNDITGIWGRDALPENLIDAYWEGRSFYLSVGIVIHKW